MSSLPSQKLAVFGGRVPAPPPAHRAHDITGAKETRTFTYLIEAIDTARQLGLDPWDFALDLAGLRALGVSDSELRWAIVMGYVEHRMEVTAGGAAHRSFVEVPNLQLTERSCFVLTAGGEDYAAAARNGSGARLFVPTVRLARIPEWEAGRRLLRIGDAIVKEFKVPAGNQELILAAFQELGWPAAIDDPLPPRDGLDRKRRLHDTINSLNRNQRRPLLKFRGKGDGQGVCWEFHQIATGLPPDSV